MDLENRVGARYLWPRLAMATPIVGVGICLEFALVFWLRFGGFAYYLAVFMAALFVLIGSARIWSDGRLARSMPQSIALLEDRVTGRYRVGVGGAKEWATRTLRFERIDQLRPWRPWKPGSRFGGGDWGAPAAAFGKFDSPLDSLRPMIRQARRDLDIGAGEPFDVIYLTEDNFTRVDEAMRRWRDRHSEG